MYIYGKIQMEFLNILEKTVVMVEVLGLLDKDLAIVLQLLQKMEQQQL